MRNKYFVILSLFLLLFCIAAYPVLIDRVAIPKRSIVQSYKQFLLKASEPLPNKIIISSGSNSLFAIDTNLLEKHFKRHTIVISDNIGYPLDHKIYNLSNYVSTGDIIILPLEFNHYRFVSSIPGDYLSFILDKLGSLSFYYRELPFYNKLNFIYKQLPFKLAIIRILSLNSFWRFNDKLLQNEIDSIYYLHRKLNTDNRGTQLSNDPEGLTILIPTKTCDNVIFPENAMHDTFKVSEKFKENLLLLKKMTRETGAQVFFTWPSVAGKPDDKCFSSKRVKNNIDTFTQQIVTEVNRHGFKFLGKIEDSNFDSSCILYTYYHIQANCAVKRTNQLIDLLEANGITPATSYSREESQKILNDYLTKIELPILGKLNPPPINVPIEFSFKKNKILLTGGWSIRNKLGVWSIGNSSTIIIPKLDTPISSIRLKGFYFSLDPDEKTGVWINGNFIGDYLLKDQVIYVDGGFDNDSYNKIVLKHSNPVSPFERGLNTDKRKLKYKLLSMELSTNFISPNVPIKINELTKSILFSDGWSIPNKTGIWSIGNTSTIVFPMLEKTVSSIRFKGDYFNGTEKTGVWINDWFVGKYVLRNQVINVAGKLNNDSYNRIILKHSNPVAPVDIDYNADPRKIKYKLYGIEFMN